MRRARTQPDATGGLPGTVATEARIVGLRDFDTTLARGGRASQDPAVDPDLDRAGLGQRRRRGPVDLADVARFGDLVRPLRWGIVLMSVGFCAYAIDKERHLQKLSRLLTVARDFGVTDRPVEVEVHEGPRR
jgi:hypothetical protein